MSEVSRFPRSATEEGRHEQLGKQLHDTVVKALAAALKEGLPEDEATSQIAVAVENYLEKDVF